MSRSTRRARLAAVTTLLLGLVFILRLPMLFNAAGYLGVLGVSVVVGSGLAGSRLWFGGHIGARVLGAAIAGTTFLGQVLNLAAGLPGARILEGRTGILGVSAMLLGLTTVALLASDRDPRQAVMPVQQPYAL